MQEEVTERHTGLSSLLAPGTSLNLRLCAPERFCTTAKRSERRYGRRLYGTGSARTLSRHQLELAPPPPELPPSELLEDDESVSLSLVGSALW